MEALEDEDPSTRCQLGPLGKSAARRASSLAVAALNDETERYSSRHAGRAVVGRIPAPVPVEESDPLPAYLRQLPERLAAGGAALGVAVVAEAAETTVPTDRPPVE